MGKKWIIALALGLLAGGLHFLYVRALKAEVRGGADVKVLVASKQIAKGEALTDESIAVRKIPAAYVDDRAIIADRADEITGAKPEIILKAGQTIQWTDFKPRADSEQNNIADLLESGQRAMTIPVDGSLSLGGLLRPGHRVDIIGTFSRGSQRSDKVTVTLLQNVSVLACGNKLITQGDEESKTRFSNVTLSVTVEEGELLAFSSSQGSLSIVLRGRQDLSTINDIPEKSWGDVWEAEKRNALQNKSPRTNSTIERIQIR